MRLQAPIGIDLVRREGEHRSLDVGVRESFEGSEEEPRVGGHSLDLGVVWDDEDRRRA